MKIQVISVLLLLSAEHIFGLNFYQKHVVKEWDGNCDEKMIAINKPGKCKRINTFIVDPDNLLGDICKGKKNQEHVTSKDQFVTHDCVKNDSKLPACAYTEEIKPDPNQKIRIKVLCEKNKPVHYEWKCN
uniref:Ribonuclease A-domain domain-containing protein n=1 Tax=Oryzias sinensis TaxID=183150 RepID=A0A8C7WTK0_9TELE